jgi:hypothetical protein
MQNIILLIEEILNSNKIIVEPLSYGIEGTENFSRKKEVNLKAFLIEGTENFSRN